MVCGQISKLYLRTSEFSRSQNEEQPACRCGFLELHKELAYMSSWAIKEFIHSFASSFTEYSERPWPRPCDIQDAGVTKRPGFAFRDLRGCECPPCPPKGWNPPPKSSHFLMLPPFLLSGEEGMRTNHRERDAVFCTPRRGSIPATGQLQLVFFISTAVPEGQSCQKQSQRVTACKFLQLNVWLLRKHQKSKIRTA